MDRRTCIFTVQITDLNNVWPLESQEIKPKAAISFKFPGTEEDSDSLFESEGVCPISPEPSEDVSSASNGVSAANEGGSTNAANFSLEIFLEFKRVSNWPLWNTLVQEPLVISIHWISPSGKTKREAGKVCVDLSRLLLQDTQIQGFFCIEDVNAGKILPYTVRKEDKESPNAKGKRPTSSVAITQEIPPNLLQNSKLRVTVSTDIPILTHIDREESAIIEFSQISGKSVLPVVQKSLQKNAENNEEDTFSYSLAFNFPGFAGFSWWTSVTGIAEETKHDIEIENLRNGKIEFKLTDKREIKSEKFENDVPVDVPQTSPTYEEQPEGFLTWNGNFKRFLPGKAVKELKACIWNQTKWRGEVARYIKPDKTGFFDPNFDRYHGKFEIDLSILLQEGVLDTTIQCPIENCEESSNETDVLLTAPIHNSETMTSLNAVEEEDSPNSTEGPCNNSWKSAGSSIMIHIKMSRPLEPIWVALPEPDLKLSDVIPSRPKLSKVEEDLEAASKEFFILINSIRQLLLKLVTKDSMQSAVVDSVDRSKRNEAIRKLLLQELHESGLLNQIRDEMKDKILKIASEKFKINETKFVDHGKFEFYNSLYVDLMLEIQKGIQKPMDERTLQESNEKSSMFQSKSSQMLHKFLNLANYYEGADRDHDKAEECFRECICLDEDHGLSLFSLACLMWHRGLLDQAEVLLRSLLALHPLEFIPWSILSQIHAARGQDDHAKSCLRKVEMLHNRWKASKKSCMEVDLFMSDLLLYPFSLLTILGEIYDLNDPYIGTARLLLDMHLPLEAHQIINLESATFSNDVSYQLLLARSYELLSSQDDTEKVVRQALNKSHECAKVWIFLGHFRYSISQFNGAITAYEKVLKILGDTELDPYARMELGNCYLHLQYFDKALDLFLKGCARNPSSGMYLGVGIACYHLGDLVNAETALLEGNILDPSNFKIWAFIALTCLATERTDEASIAFEEALKTFPSASLLKELASAFAAKGKYRNAGIALSEALKEEESPETRLHLANMLYCQGKIELAQTEYSKILEQEDTPQELRERASAALAQVLSAERRILENVSAA